MLSLVVESGTVANSGQDCYAVTDVEVVDRSTLGSVNTMGHLKVWDLRAGMQQPKRSITL